MGNSLAISRPLIESFNFALSIDSFSSSAFTKISSLTVNTSVSTYKEAGAILPIKDPDEVSFTNLSLETGASADLTFYNWSNNIIQNIMGFGSGMPVALDKRNATLYCFGRDKSITKKIQIYGAFPVEFTAGEWDNDQDRVLIEKLVIAYDYFVIY